MGFGKKKRRVHGRGSTQLDRKNGEDRGKKSGRNS